MIHLDYDACIFGWGPCLDGLGFSHCCKKRAGHVGYHICDWCGHRKRTSEDDFDLLTLDDDLEDQ